MITIWLVWGELMFCLPLLEADQRVGNSFKRSSGTGKGRVWKVWLASMFWKSSSLTLTNPGGGLCDVDLDGPGFGGQVVGVC